ncbi:Phosphatidylinositolglycan class N-domain-containing protein [Baffinella frigidus]|nr:Phosphatidylinositolglycan class N-domain-containing protein [Cryptophyta sp. CCMP2293]
MPPAAKAAIPRGRAGDGGTTVALMAVVFHLCAFASVFDIYFRSPIVSGLHAVDPPAGAAARRLVLIIGDGGRADMVFDTRTHTDGGLGGALARGLHGKILRGETSWGVSHTRVPTESRPCHASLLGGIYEDPSAITKGWQQNPVEFDTAPGPCHASLLGGIYEDPSAITKGWQQNPVEFDTVLNASSAAFAFGSPDVIPLFAKGLAHVTADVYPSEWEDFGSACFDDVRGCRRLDDWVLDRLDAELASAEANPGGELDRRLRGDKVVIFLHLLGLDMQGHAFRPDSAEYRANIRSVDEGIARVEARLAKFFRDDRATAFLFTSDHGMSNKGSHGDGEPECTETPIVAWGAGVARTAPSKGGVVPGHAGGKVAGWGASPETWGGLRGVERKDVEQARLASLMAALIGVPFPRNAVETLPLEYLDIPAGSPRRAALLLANARQMLEGFKMIEGFKMKEHLKRSITPALLFRPFPTPPLGPLSARAEDIAESIASLEAGDVARSQGTGRAASVNGAVAAAVDEVVEAARKLVLDVSEGLTYYDTYDRAFLQSVIVIAYAGGGTLLLAFAHRASSPTGSLAQGASISPLPSTGALVLAAIFFAALLALHSPLQYLLYVGYAVYLWDRALAHSPLALLAALRFFLRGAPSTPAPRALLARCVALGILQMMVLGFFNRAWYTPGHLLLALAGVAWSRGGAGRGGWGLRAGWVVACAASSVFTLLSVEMGDEDRLVMLGGVLLISGAIGGWVLAKRLHEHAAAAVLAAQGCLAVVAAALLWVSIIEINSQRGLSLMLWASNWSVLAVALILPNFTKARTKDARLRLWSLSVGWGTPYMLLSVNYETCFYAALCSQLMSDVGSALVLLFLTNAAFFGTGNIASVSSFELRSVYRFMTTFEPFLMTALLLFKMALPFVLVSTTFGLVCELNKVPRSAVLCIVLLLSAVSSSVLCIVLVLADMMSVQFFFAVRSQGSWKEIGNSISIFGISNLFMVMIQACTCAQLLFIATRPYVTGVALLRAPAP